MSHHQTVSDIFEFESSWLFNKAHENMKVRVDYNVDISLSSDGRKGCVDPSTIEIHEITDMDSGRDITYLTNSVAMMGDIIRQVNKREQYLMDKTD